MPTLTKRDARKYLHETLSKEFALLAPEYRSLSAGSVEFDIEKITDKVFKILETDKSAASYVALLNPLPPHVPDWIKTEEVANMLGYSRPYVAALLDSEDFAGQVRKSKGGQRSVKRSDVQAWMDAHRMSGPAKTAERNLLDSSPDEFFIQEAASKEDEAAALHRIEQENLKSDKHRPKRVASRQ